MPISALVITLSDTESLRSAAVCALKDDPMLEVGAACGNRLPVVAETPTLSESRQLFDRLQLTRGIQFVDVVSVNFEDCEF